MRAIDVPANIMEALETLWSGYLAMPAESLGDTLLLAEYLAPIESPLAELGGMSRQGMVPAIDLLVDDEMMSSILADSAEEVESLLAALRS
jgi:hypothetical protein